ncbi:MAG: hypothetical protein H7X71_04795 [Chitinophagales bacterium]|nr:hypothetical protein [Chitinophagales bacterium]
MLPSARKKFNASFTEEKYLQFFHNLYDRFPYKIDFKVCETPVFIPAWLKEKLLQAGEDIIDVICRKDFKKITERAVPQNLQVPGEDENTVFLALDFGICIDEAGQISPQLIEMQGFASLHGYQHSLGKGYRTYFDIESGLSHLFNGLHDDSYEEFLRRTIVADHHTENVILLEIEPEKQKTWVDFWITKEITGVEPVCISKIIKEGKDLFYEKGGRKIKIERIYNRLIFDEFLLRKDLPVQWNITDEANVEWVSHPNWFFRISKYTLPYIKSEYVPETNFLHEVKSMPADLENYVLKPLFSFAGSGVIFDVKEEDIKKITDPENFILQRKVTYHPCIETPDIPAKFEMRLMYIWEKNRPRPTLVINLVRLSKGAMVGVNFNKGKSWVGGTVGYFE